MQDIKFAISLILIKCKFVQTAKKLKKKNSIQNIFTVVINNFVHFALLKWIWFTNMTQHIIGNELITVFLLII